MKTFRKVFPNDESRELENFSLTPVGTRFLLSGLDLEIITSFVAIDRIATLLQGKGGGKKGRYQGKASTLKTRNDVEEFLKEFTALSVNSSA